MLCTRLKVAAATRSDSAPILAGLREEVWGKKTENFNFFVILGDFVCKLNVRKFMLVTIHEYDSNWGHKFHFTAMDKFE